MQSSSMLGNHASAIWLGQLKKILYTGRPVNPRGMKTLELLHSTVRMSMSHPVVLTPERKLSYKFLAGEALWILEGDDRVETIARYNANIAQFSDDGVKFFGAYGPKIASQFAYVTGKLLEDRDSRQAVLTIWRENPPQTKDFPCTVAMAFSIRDDYLHSHVFMRSSDAWLGLPYDVFNFTMVAAKVACHYNVLRDIRKHAPIRLGWLHLTMASSHLYERNWIDAERCIRSGDGEVPWGERMPDDVVERGDWHLLEKALWVCRENIDPVAHQACWRIRP